MGSRYNMPDADLATARVVWERIIKADRETSDPNGAAHVWHGVGRDEYPALAVFCQGGGIFLETMLDSESPNMVFVRPRVPLWRALDL